MNVTHSIAIIAVTAACTIFLRAVPFLLFGGNRQVPDVIHYLGKYLPAAIMVTLAVYCLRNVDFAAETHGLAEILSVALVVGMHAWKRNILLTVLSGTVCYMFLVQAVFM